MKNKITILLLMVSIFLTFGCKGLSKEEKRDAAYIRTKLIASRLKKAEANGATFDNIEDLRDIYSDSYLSVYAYNNSKEPGVMLFHKEAVIHDGKLTHYGISTDYRLLIIQYAK